MSDEYVCFYPIVVTSDKNARSCTRVVCTIKYSSSFVTVILSALRRLINLDITQNLKILDQFFLSNHEYEIAVNRTVQLSKYCDGAFLEKNGTEKRLFTCEFPMSHVLLSMMSEVAHKL